jgi:hypothetical protein
LNPRDRTSRSASIDQAKFLRCENLLDFIKENLNIILSVVGLFCSAAGSLIEKVAPAHRRGVRGALIILAIVGFIVAAVGTVQQSEENRAQKQQIGPLMEAAQTTQDPSSQDIDERLDQIQAELRVNAPTGSDKRRVATASSKPAEHYFVQIDSDASPEALRTYADRLQRVYNVSGNFAGVVETRSGSASRYRLAFGQHLDRATAQRYARIADSLSLCPPGHVATIEPQPQ